MEKEYFFSEKDNEPQRNFVTSGDSQPSIIRHEPLTRDSIAKFLKYVKKQRKEDEDLPDERIMEEFSILAKEPSQIDEMKWTRCHAHQ